MTYDRIEVRLDEEHQKKLSDLKVRYGETVSDIVRRGIDAVYEEEMRKMRHQALEEILAMEGIEDVPDMDTLKRQLGRHPDYSPYDDLPRPD